MYLFVYLVYPALISNNVMTSYHIIVRRGPGSQQQQQPMVAQDLSSTAKKVFVGGLSADSSPEVLTSFFSQYGKGNRLYRSSSCPTRAWVTRTSDCVSR